MSSEHRTGALCSEGRAAVTALPSSPARPPVLLDLLNNPCSHLLMLASSGSRRVSRAQLEKSAESRGRHC